MAHQSNAHLFKNPKYADVKFKLPDKTFLFAHRIVLGLNPFFEQIFCSELPLENNIFVVEKEISGFDHNIFEIYVEAIYSNEYTSKKITIDINKENKLCPYLKWDKLFFRLIVAKYQIHFVYRM
jgi:hypothetical protein